MLHKNKILSKFLQILANLSANRSRDILPGYANVQQMNTKMSSSTSTSNGQKMNELPWPNLTQPHQNLQQSKKPMRVTYTNPPGLPNAAKIWPTR